MADKTPDRPEKKACIPYEKMSRYQQICHEHGVSSLMGLWHKMAREANQKRANEDRLIAAGFLAAREPPAPPPPPPARLPFASWAKKHDR